MISKSGLEDSLRQLEFSEEKIQEILKGWNDESDSQICKMLSEVGMKRSFVIQNKDKYFFSNVYDMVKHRLEKQLADAQLKGKNPEANGLAALLVFFEDNKYELKQITEFHTIIEHMDRCRKHE